LYDAAGSRQRDAADLRSVPGYYLFRQGKGRVLVVSPRLGQWVRVHGAIEVAVLEVRDEEVTLGLQRRPDEK